jgi:hypothetical protein
MGFPNDDFGGTGNILREYKNRLVLSYGVLFALFVAILLMTGASFYRLIEVSVSHLRAPHDIFFETHNLATIKSISQNAPIYSPKFYNDLPYIITSYNPLYHYLVAALPESSTNPFLTGRIVSFVCMILSALMLFVVRGSHRSIIGPILFTGWIFLLHLPVQFAAYMRNDALALFLSIFAVVLVDQEGSNKFRIAMAAFFGFAAFTAKQSFLSATFACFLYLWLNHRRNAKFFGLLSLSLYGGFAAFAEGVWGYGYWSSVYLSHLSSPINFRHMVSMLWDMLKEPLFTLLVIVTAGSIWYSLAQNGFKKLVRSPYPLYLALATLVLLATVGKIGSDKNYFLEFIFASCLWNTAVIKALGSTLIKRLWISPMLVLFGFLCFAELKWADSRSYSFTDAETTRYIQAVLNLTKRELAELEAPNKHFLAVNTQVLDYTVLDEVYINDPFNYWLMWNHGSIDINPLLRAIENRYFSVILLVSPENPYSMTALTFFPEGAKTRLFFETLREHYVLKKRGVFLYFVPSHRENVVSPIKRPSVKRKISSVQEEEGGTSLFIT